jgi:hypothetical protein
MEFLFNLFGNISNFFDEIINDINYAIKIREKRIKLGRLVFLKSSNFLITVICFLLGNASAMSAFIFADSLGKIGLIFPVSSCVVLYGIAISSAVNLVYYANETKFYKREFEENYSEE